MSKTLDEIVKAFQDYTASWGYPTNQDAHDRGLEVHKQTILDWVNDEVVGEDETSNARPDKLKQSAPHQRNQVRKKQRAILKQHGWKEPK